MKIIVIDSEGNRTELSGVESVVIVNPQAVRYKSGDKGGAWYSKQIETVDITDET